MGACSKEHRIDKRFRGILLILSESLTIRPTFKHLDTKLNIIVKASKFIRKRSFCSFIRKSKTHIQKICTNVSSFTHNLGGLPVRSEKLSGFCKEFGHS